MRKSMLALFLVAFAASSHAATAWKSGQTKDEDGNVICVYSYRLGHIYSAPDFGDYCPLTIEVDDD